MMMMIPASNDMQRFKIGLNGHWLLLGYAMSSLVFESSQDCLSLCLKVCDDSIMSCHVYESMSPDYELCYAMNVMSHL